MDVSDQGDMLRKLEYKVDATRDDVKYLKEGLLVQRQLDHVCQVQSVTCKCNVQLFTFL